MASTDDTPQGNSVADLVAYAVELATGGAHDRDGIAKAILVRIRQAHSDQTEQKEKFGLVETQLQQHPEWLLRFPNHDGGSSNNSGKQGVPPVNHDEFTAIKAQIKILLQQQAAQEEENRRKTAEVENLRRTIEQERLQRAAGENARQTLSNQPLFSTTNPNWKSSSYKIKDPEVFTGSSKDYPHWKMHMDFKLQSNVPPEKRVKYIFGRLDKMAARVAFSWMKQFPDGREHEFWKFLDDQFEDKLEAEKARTRLLTCQQKNQRLQLFNNDFMRWAYEAEETNNQTLKAIYLAALRKDLRDRMISVEVPNTWTIRNLMDRVVVIEENIYRAKLRAPRLDAKDEDAMDWEASKVSAVRSAPGPTNNATRSTSSGNQRSRTKAKWVQKDEMDRRKKKKLCLRCGDPEHFVKQCPYLPAERPARASPAKVDDDSSEDSTSGEEFSNHESEN